MSWMMQPDGSSVIRLLGETVRIPPLETARLDRLEDILFIDEVKTLKHKVENEQKQKVKDYFLMILTAEREKILADLIKRDLLDNIEDIDHKILNDAGCNTYGNRGCYDIDELEDKRNQVFIDYFTLDELYETHNDAVVDEILLDAHPTDSINNQREE